MNSILVNCYLIYNVVYIKVCMTVCDDLPVVSQTQKVHKCPVQNEKRREHDELG